MGNVAVGGVNRLIQTLWDSGTVAALDDSELLGRFLRHDAIAEAAFTALVQKHAPMVLRVCHDVTGDPHDAQDAAQATFLILAQRARFIRRREALANWLFGTARRVASRARRDAARRRRLEREYAETIASSRPDVASPDETQLDWAGLHEELARLPERYRIPIVLCDLEGLTHEQAAVAIACPVRTLETRLYRGRQRLRQRLIRRGLAPSGAFAVGAMNVDAAWASSTALAAMKLLRGQSMATAVSANVFKLVRGANRAMFLTKLQCAAVIVIIAGACSALTLGFAGMPTPSLRLPGDPPSTRQVQVPPAKKAADAGSTQPTAPITVSGRATDGTGKSVAGATIYLVSTNRTNARLGTTTTAQNGTYTFRDAPLPVARTKDSDPLAGTFQVYGTAPGFGFAWHGMRFYTPQPRPVDWNRAGEDPNLFLGEPLVMDLHFAPARTISGRVADETGRPVPDATIRILTCDYLDTEHKETHHNFREFWSIQSAPKALTTATTGPDGRFRLEGLPKEVGFWVRVEHPDYARFHLHAATTDRPITAFDYPLGRIVGSERPPVETGALNVTIRSTRRIDVRTVFAASRKPAPSIQVTALQGNSANGYSASGITDASGNLTLRLPPGDFDMEANPTSNDTNCIRTRSKFKAADAPKEQSLELRVDEGCVVILEAVDAKSGEGIPELTFWSERDDRKGTRWQVQRNTWFIDNPTTDANGRLRAVLAPGAAVFSMGHVPESTGYQSTAEQKRVKLIAGETVTIRFKLDR